MMSEREGVKEGMVETEIGPLPDSWQVRRLKSLVEFSRKPRNLNLGRYDRIPFVPMDLIPESGFFVDTYEPREPEDIRSGTYFERGDILLAKITPSFENGKQGIVDKIPIPFGYATTEVYNFHPLPDTADRAFLFYYFKTPEIRADLAAKMEGTTGRQRIRKSVIEKFAIPLPPLPEQRAIARVLDTVQRAIQATERVIAAAQELKRSLMHHLFTYGPVPVQEAANVPLKETEIGPVPQAWQVVKIGDVCRVKVTFPSFKSIDELDSGESTDEMVLALKVSDMNAGGSKYLANANLSFRHPQDILEDDHHFLRPGSVVFPKRGGAIATNKKRITQHWSILDPNMIGVEPSCSVDLKYLFAYFESLDLAQLQDNTTVPQLNKRDVIAIELPLAPDSQQRKIGEILASVDRKLSEERGRQIALQVFFDSLLHNLMSGKVRVEPGESDLVEGGEMGETLSVHERSPAYQQEEMWDEE